MDSQEAALRYFFDTYIEDTYTKDSEGYAYFSEDFYDPDDPLGDILQI